MKIPFVYYVHDNSTRSERAETIYNQTSEIFEGTKEDLVKVLGTHSPFLEVTLRCELDTETGQVTILSATP